MARGKAGGLARKRRPSNAPAVDFDAARRMRVAVLYVVATVGHPLSTGQIRDLVRMDKGVDPALTEDALATLVAGDVLDVHRRKTTTGPLDDFYELAAKK
jgi:hypothetical protein